MYTLDVDNAIRDHLAASDPELMIETICRIWVVAQMWGDTRQQSSTIVTWSTEDRILSCAVENEQGRLAYFTTASSKRTIRKMGINKGIHDK